MSGLPCNQGVSEFPEVRPPINTSIALAAVLFIGSFVFLFLLTFVSHCVYLYCKVDQCRGGGASSAGAGDADLESRSSADTETGSLDDSVWEVEVDPVLAGGGGGSAIEHQLVTTPQNSRTNYDNYCYDNRAFPVTMYL